MNFFKLSQLLAKLINSPRNLLRKSSIFSHTVNLIKFLEMVFKAFSGKPFLTVSKFTGDRSD